jgi:hypothetical protein
VCHGSGRCVWVQGQLYALKAAHGPADLLALTLAQQVSNNGQTGLRSLSDPCPFLSGLSFTHVYCLALLVPILSVAHQGEARRQVPRVGSMPCRFRPTTRLGTTGRQPTRHACSGHTKESHTRIDLIEKHGVGKRQCVCSITYYSVQRRGQMPHPQGHHPPTFALPNDPNALQ